MDENERGERRVFAAITDAGLEDFSLEEIIEILGKNAEIVSKGRCVVKFIASYEQACRLCYLAQSIKRCILVFSDAEISANLEESAESVSALLKKEELEFLKDSSFMVECERTGSHNFQSVDLAREIGASIMKMVGCHVEFKNPKYMLFSLAAENHCITGLDFSGFDLSKREYKIFNHPNSLKGTVAYALFRNGFDAVEKIGNKNKPSEYSILNPFCRSGVVAIEGAIFSSRLPIHYFRKDAFSFLGFEFLKESLDFSQIFSKIDADAVNDSDKSFRIFASDREIRNISSAKKNAKIAGVEKKIRFSRNDMEWLDIKFDDRIIDSIISDVSLSKIDNREKVWKEFFNQCSLLLKDSGAISIVSRDEEIMKKFAGEYGFCISQHKQVWQGQQLLDFYLIKRKE
ncbi:MAG: THUMP domain-containing protein [Candidatus Woesearchaeota archaeon]|nr:THUMP domain-containing protein [Candidatus Woesearchaeota archaeon]